MVKLCLPEMATFLYYLDSLREWKLTREAAQRGELTTNKRFDIEISKKLGHRI
jgi:hypothetical protein